MHQPRPYGLHVIGLPLTDKDESFISSVATRITNLKGVAGVDSMKMVYDLPDGGYVIVQDMGGNFRVIAHKPRQQDSYLFDGLAGDFIPMLYSGVITKPIAHETEGVGFDVTEQTRHRLRNYDTAKEYPKKALNLKRFRIAYAQKFQEFIPKITSAYLRTQYHQLKPTWYSGAMAEVMQIVGGYGRQDIENLPDDKLERARLIIPANIAEAIKDELGDIRLPAYTGYPARNGQFQYDYKFNSTNAIGFDTSNKPWLLQIASNGVWAMPLPIIPATRTSAFRRYIESVKDSEIIAILDRFGAMPSGESFPVGDDFETWRRAGAIIKVCDASDFYSHITYSSALGWSLNSKGTEGYNTCYDYDDETALGYGLTYNLSLNLVATDEHYGALSENVDEVMLPERAVRVREYINGLLSTLELGTTTTRAILYKLRRAGLYAIHDRSLTHQGHNDRDYWRNLELKPIAAHSGKISEVYKGVLFHPAKFEYQPQIKFPEPLVGACLSHDFLPTRSVGINNDKPNSDTIMMAYYVGDTLNVVKYFVDWATFRGRTEGDFNEYMTVGSWRQVQQDGEVGVQGWFYTSEIDGRELVAPTTVTTTVKGEDLGFDSIPRFAFDGPAHMCGTLRRYRYYTHKTLEVRDAGKKIDIAICIPYFCRNAVIHAKKDEVVSRRVIDLFQLKSIQDPTTYRFWTYHFLWAYIQMTIKNPAGVPSPVDGSPVWVEEVNYIPYNGSDFADDGNWLPALPHNITWLVHPNANEWRAEGGGNPPKVDDYRKENNVGSVVDGDVRLSLMGPSVLVNKSIPSSQYFTGSPDSFGFTFYRDACAITFGQSEYKNTSEPSENNERAYWGGSRLPDHKSAHHFIGVINE